MKRWTHKAVAIALAAMLLLPGAALAAEDMNMMKKDMKDMDMKDMDMMEKDMKDMSKAYEGVETMKKGGIVYVQLRQLATNLDFMIGWNGKTKTATLSKKMMKDDMTSDMSPLTIEFMIGSMTISVNGMEKETMYKPMLKGGRTYISKELADMYLFGMM